MGDDDDVGRGKAVRFDLRFPGSICFYCICDFVNDDDLFLLIVFQFLS